MEFHYPWLPAKCNLCGKWGHTERVCVRNDKDKKKREDIIGSKSDSDGTNEKGEKVKEQNLVVIDKVLQEEECNKEEEELPRGHEDSQVYNWSTVPSVKLGRSSPGHVSVIQISASKFSVLSVEDQNGVKKESYMIYWAQEAL